MSIDYSNHRRGVPSARKNLAVSKLALSRYSGSDEDWPEDRMLYGGAFFVFLRASLYALKNSDAKEDPSLLPFVEDAWEARIKPSDVFKAIHDERCFVAHGDDGWAIHPSLPITLLNRAADEGIDCFDIVFAQEWHFEPFKGMAVIEVMDNCWRQVSAWIDAIDAAHASSPDRVEDSEADSLNTDK